MDELTKHEALTWETTVCVLSPADSQYLFILVIFPNLNQIVKLCGCW